MSAVSVSQVCSYGYGYGNLLSSRNRCSPSSNFAISLVPSCGTHGRAARPRPMPVMQVSAGGVYELSSQISQSLYSLAEEIADGPIELPAEIDPFAIPETTPLQAAASVVLTGLITVLLYRSIQRRSKRAKENKFRSTGEQPVKQDAMSVKEDARKSALALLQKTPEIDTPPPNALQTFSGAVVAGVIALVLYRFTVTVEGGFVNKVVSTNYSIRNLTITVRTIVTGLCYLATFVFAANSIGLTLLSLQLALNIGGSAQDSDKRDAETSESKLSEKSAMDAATRDDDRGPSE